MRASRSRYCIAATTGWDFRRAAVNGGSISIGPYGMTGARCTGHALIEGKRRGAKYVVVKMCGGCWMGAAGLFEAVQSVSYLGGRQAAGQCFETARHLHFALRWNQ